MADVNPFPTPYPQPTAQLVYLDTPAQPRPGVLADVRPATLVTGIMPAAYANFGTLVVNDPAITSDLDGQGTQGVKAPASENEVNAGCIGIVMRTGAMESRRDLLPPSYEPGDLINICRSGVIWTASESPVVKHGPVYVRITANGALDTLGALRDDADGGTAILVPGAKWYDTQATEGAPARVELNLIGQ